MASPPPPPSFLLVGRRGGFPPRPLCNKVWESTFGRDAMSHGVAHNATDIQNKLLLEGESLNGIWRGIVKSILG